MRLKELRNIIKNGPLILVHIVEYNVFLPGMLADKLDEIIMRSLNKINILSLIYKGLKYGKLELFNVCRY